MNEIAHHLQVEIMKTFLNPSVLRPTAELEIFTAETQAQRRFRYCSNLIRTNNIHPKLLHRLFYVNKEERDSDADKLLKKSLDHWDHSRPRSAFTTVNQAIGIACSNEMRQKALIQRSRIYYWLKAYEECLQSFRRANALDVVYNEQAIMINECNQEMSQCASKRMALNKLLNETEFHQIAVPMACMPRANESTLHPALRLIEQTSKLGVRRRQVVSGKSFRVGEVIVIDRSLNSVLLPETHSQRCNWCYKEQFFALRPCTTYDCPAMYCSSDCTKQALLSNHENECSLMQFMHELEVARPVVRVVMTTFRDVHDITEWNAFRKFSNVGEHTIFAFAGMKTPPRNYRAKLLYAMGKKTRLRTNTELFYFARLTAYVYKAIKYETYMLYTLFETNSERALLRDFIYYQLLAHADHTQVLRTSSTVRMPGERQQQQPYARAVMPVTTLIQHSCTPNVAVFSCALQQVAVCVVRPIAKNDALTMDKAHGRYDGTGAQHKSAQREFLHDDCACPTNPADMPFSNEASALGIGNHHLDNCGSLRWSADSEEMQHLFDRPVHEVRRKFEDICQFMQAYDDLYPCRELYEVRRCFDLCAERLFGPVIFQDLATDVYADRRRALTSTIMEREEKRKRGELCSEPSDDSNASAIQQLSQYATKSRRNSRCGLLEKYGEEVGLAHTMFASAVMPAAVRRTTLDSISSSVLDQTISQSGIVSEVHTSDEEQLDEESDIFVERDYAEVYEE